MSDRPSPVRRISVAVTPAVAEELIRLVDEVGLTLNEAANQLMSCGKLVLREIQRCGEVTLESPDGRRQTLSPTEGSTR